ncbi:MAG: 60S ribosomal protein L22 [Candidatus Bathyarchaeota archaeon]|nr:60S ribosomal protein L22 [Candidatus Bathyarchaeota archaeon]
MVEVKVDATKMKGEEKDMFPQLAAFLKDKTGGEVSNDGGKMTVMTEAVGVNKKYVKVLLKKFLHHKALKDSYRVIGGEEDALSINKRKVFEED